MVNFSEISPSRLNLIINADSLKEASKMGILDRIIDFFRGNVKREAIEFAFNSIANIKNESPSIGEDLIDEIGVNDNAEHRPAVEKKMELLYKLRDWSLPEYRDQFLFDLTQSPNGKYSVNITIGGTEIYRNDDITDEIPQDRLPDFFQKYLHFNLKDLTSTKDLSQAYQAKSQLIQLTELARTSLPRNEFYLLDNKLEKNLTTQTLDPYITKSLLSDLPDESLLALHSLFGDSDFASRLAGVFNYAANAWEASVQIAADNKIVRNSMGNPDANHWKALAIKDSNKIASQHLQDFRDIAIACGEILDERPALSQSSENAVTYTEKLNFSEDSIQHYSELEPEEIKLLVDIGFPNTILDFRNNNYV